MPRFPLPLHESLAPDDGPLPRRLETMCQAHRLRVLEISQELEKIKGSGVSATEKETSLQVLLEELGPIPKRTECARGTNRSVNHSSAGPSNSRSVAV